MKQKVLYILLLLFACAWNTQAWGYGDNTSYVLDYPTEQELHTIDEGASLTLSGPPAQLTYQAYRAKNISGSTYVYVQYKTSESEWQDFNHPSLGTSWTNVGPINVPADATQIRFITKTGNTLVAHVRNVKVTRLTTLSADKETIPFGTGTFNTESSPQTLTATYNNTTYNQKMTVSVPTNFIVSQNTIDVGATGSQAITVKYKPTTTGNHSGNVTVNMNGKSVSVSVSGSCFPIFNYTATAKKNIDEAGTATVKFDGAAGSTATKNGVTLSNADTKTDSQNATFEASAASGYEFVGWGTSADATSYESTRNPYQVTITNTTDGTKASTTAEKTLYAIFKELPIFYFKASAISSPSAGGSATAQIANGTASANASYTEQAPTLATESITKEVSFSATPNTNEGYDFSGWAESAEGEIISKENPYTINITSSAKSEPATPQKTLYARFSKKLTPHVNTEVSEMKVGDVVVPAFSFTNTDNPTFVITHTPEEAGVAVISYDQSTNTLSALNAGTAKIKFTQAETSTINSGTDEFTITVSKNTAILTSLLPATMTVDDEITNIYSLTENDNTNPVTISSSNENVLRYDTESKKLVACGGGTATITIAQDANYKWNSISTSVDIAVNKLTPSFTLNTEGAIYYVGQKRKDFLTLDEGDETLFTYSSTNPNVADVKDGYLELYSEGSATITVTHQTSSRWSEVSKSFSVSPQTTANHVPIQVDGSNYQSFLSSTNGNIYWQDNGIRMTENGFNWDDKYVIIAYNGIPDKLSFSYKLGNGGATGISFYVEESDNGTSFTNVWSVSNASTSYTNVSDLQLKPTTRFVKLCYSGNFGGFFSNINITELKYFKSDKTELNFGTNDEGASVTPQSFTFSFCNAGIPTNISIDDTNFSVSLSQVPNTGRDKMGTQEISVTYLNTTPGEHTGTLTIADEEGNKQTVSLKGTTNITTLNLYPDQALSYTAGKTYPTVILNRTLKQGYNTLALPFDTDVETLTGRNNSNDWVAQLALVTKNDQDGYTLYFTKVEDGTITANQPYILYLGTAVVNPTWTNMTVVAAESKSFSTEKNKGWTMKSNYEPEFSMSGKYGIVNKDGNIQKGASSSTLKAFSAYLEGPANSQVKAAFLDDATAIEEILQQADEDTVIKRIENGKLVILQGDKKYNASGVRLK